MIEPVIGSGRHALVIGNNDYLHLPILRTAVGDARAMSAALERLEFTVQREENVDHDAFVAALGRFADQIQPDDEAIIHFSGHGVSVEGYNYLLPVSMVKRPSQAQIRRLSLEVGAMIEEVRSRDPKYVFAIIDACRDNPFGHPLARSIGLARGLTKFQVETGVFILYSAGPGQAALDRLGDADPYETSVFTRVLLDYIEVPDSTLHRIAKSTQGEVKRLAASICEQQMPVIMDQVDDEPVLRPVLTRAAIAGVEYVPRLPPSRRPSEMVRRKRLDLGVGAFFQALLQPLLLGRSAGEGEAPLDVLVPSRECIGNSRAVESLHAIAVSPDGNRLATASSDTIMRFWDTDSGRLERCLTGHAGIVRSVAFSPAGDLAASAGQDGTVRLWDATTGVLSRILAPHKGLVRSVAFSSDGGTLAAVDLGTGVRMWDAGNGALLDDVNGHSGCVRSIAFSHDGQMFASGDEDGITNLRDCATNRIVQTFSTPSDCVTALAFSPTSGILAFGTEEGVVGLLEPGGGPGVTHLGDHPKLVGSIAFTLDGETLASTSEDGTVILWDLKSGERLWTLAEPGRFVFSLAFCARDHLLALGGWGNEIRFVERQSGHIRGRLLALPDGEWAAIGGQGYSASEGAEHHLRLIRNGSVETIDSTFQNRWLRND